MKEITVDILKTAFRKFLTATYYDKTDMVQRYHVALFVKKLESDGDRVFEELLEVAKGDNPELLEKWLQGVSLSFYPKKVSSIDEQTDEHVITNVPPKEMIVERLLVKASIPVELSILDVSWLLLFGYKVDSTLRSNSYGNRMDLIANESGVRIGNALFKKYQNQYKYWWENGIKAANSNLKQGENITIINFDISNCYHSIDFDFNSFLTFYDSKWPEDSIKDVPLTNVLIRIYQRYWEVTQASDEEVFCGFNVGKRPMPLALPSAHVLANWYLSPLDDYIQEAYQPLYYGRYVDDCMVVVKTKSGNDNLMESIDKELPGLMKAVGDNTIFAFAQNIEDGPYNRLSTFELQQDKLYVYRFNCLLPQSSLDEFVQGQMERSSEFRFLTDDADTGNVNLEFVTLVNTLDAEEEPGRRFNILEENKYKLAVYLAKLATKLAKYGTAYEHYDEVDKVYNYFTDGLLIKHHQLWERLMTIYVLAGKKDYVAEFIDKAKHQINELRLKDGLFLKDLQYGRQKVVDSLIFHLDQSIIMAVSLHKESDDISSLYLDTFMTRMHYNQLPLQEFSVKYDSEGVRLQMNSHKIQEHLLSYKWMPYYVKYYAIVSALSLGDVYNPDVYKRAFDIYCKLNHVGHSFDWMAFCRPPQSDEVTEFNVDLAFEPLYEDKRTVAVVEMDIEDKTIDDSIDHYGVVNPDKIKVFDDILDQITNIYKTDIFILPELALPIYELMVYCLYSAKHEVAYVAGMEYVVCNDTVYNYIITCLPITLYGQRDAIPVIRLKNHYAPKELNHIIIDKGKKVPAMDIVWQNIYHWHGHLFTSYYCFELASIVERSFFFSKIDAMYCPVFNKDTYYFNNIAESTARDMHCYFVLSNVSHYGDGRVTKPASHMVMNMLKVKGGNTIDNKAVVLSAELDIDDLRRFQVLDERQQESDNSFKQTPPNYDKSQISRRKKERFLYPYKDWNDACVANIVEFGMRY